MNSANATVAIGRTTAYRKKCSRSASVHESHSHVPAVLYFSLDAIGERVRALYESDVLALITRNVIDRWLRLRGASGEQETGKEVTHMCLHPIG